MRESKGTHKSFKGPKPLKADLHIHTAEDPQDRVKHTAKELISRAAAQGFDVLAITNHHSMTFDQNLFAYARERNILLIPGVEVSIRRRHVLLLNPPKGKKVSDFASLSGLRRPETMIVAPHPYFPGMYSLNGFLLKNGTLFDALEYCHFYTPGINFNQRAVDVCRTYGYPLIGNSDSHFLFQLGLTYSLIYAEKNIESIFAAIRAGKLKVVTRPLSAFEMGSIARRFLRMKLQGNLRGVSKECRFGYAA
jgi:predicted metal-dependent phosphoesterase TrpH